MKYHWEKRGVLSPLNLFGLQVIETNSVLLKQKSQKDVGIVRGIEELKNQVLEGKANLETTQHD